jgi:hypothetical protein
VEGPDQSTTKLITLLHSVHWGFSAIGQNYDRADEDLLLEMYKAGEWETLIGGVYALGDRAPVPGSGPCATGVMIGGQMRHRCNAWALVTCSTVYFKP